MGGDPLPSRYYVRYFFTLASPEKLTRTSNYVIFFTYFHNFVFIFFPISTHMFLFSVIVLLLSLGYLVIHILFDFD